MVPIIKVLYTKTALTSLDFSGSGELLAPFNDQTPRIPLEDTKLLSAATVRSLPMAGGLNPWIQEMYRKLQNQWGGEEDECEDEMYTC